MNTANSDALIRARVWSTDLKDVLVDTLEANKYVRWITDFPDGNQLTIPSLGAASPARDYIEDTAVTYDPLDTGEFNFTINQYIHNGTYITKKAKQDTFYLSELEAAFVPKQARAIAERLEADIWKEGQPRTGNPAGYQVAGNVNAINGASHRRVGSSVLNSKQVLGVQDFAAARYALKKANVPDQNLIAIVDPSVEYIINTQTNLTNISFNPKWEGIITTGIAQGNQFQFNIFGFDVYTSQRLPICGTSQNGASETIGGTASGANAVCNLFFSATPDILPYIGAWRQMPEVDTDYNKDFQRDEYVTTARYGTKIYRPENLVTILSDPSAVS